MNTCVSRIAWWHARVGGFAASLYPFHFLNASEDEDANDGSGDDDEYKDEHASSSNDEEMTAS